MINFPLKLVACLVQKFCNLQDLTTQFIPDILAVQITPDQAFKI